MTKRRLAAYATQDSFEISWHRNCHEAVHECGLSGAFIAKFTQLPRTTGGLGHDIDFFRGATGWIVLLTITVFMLP